MPEEVDKFNQEIQYIIEESNAKDDEIEDEEELAPPKKTILKKSKTYNYNAWEDIKEWKINMTLQQLAELVPTAKQQIRTGLANVKPGYKVVEMNLAKIHKREEEESEEEWDEEERDEPEHSSAYTQCYIEGRPTPAIVDSGAGGVILSEATMKELGWRIEAPTRQTMIVADGHRSRPLGRVFELPIQFGPMIIPITAIVVDIDSYDLVLGNTWLRKVHTILDFGALKI